MESLLDLVQIKIDLKLQNTLLAKVTLKWQDEFEIRFCRLTMRTDGSLWFQPPALKDFGWAKCFIVPDVDKWRMLEKKVISVFIEEVEKKVEEGEVSPSFLEKIKSKKEEEVTEEDWDKIDNTNL